MHTISKKVYYHDTDCGGVVYYANYLKYLEEARTEYLAERGIVLTELARDGFIFVVKKVDIEYKSPARYADYLAVVSQVSGMRSASVTFKQEVKRDDSVLVVAETVLVCIDKNFRPAAMPASVVSRLK
jgi:acyl-CoA thioester hydrolase